MDLHMIWLKARGFSPLPSSSAGGPSPAEDGSSQVVAGGRGGGPQAGAASRASSSCRDQQRLPDAERALRPSQASLEKEVEADGVRAGDCQHRRRCLVLLAGLTLVSALGALLAWWHGGALLPSRHDEPGEARDGGARRVPDQAMKELIAAQSQAPMELFRFFGDEAPLMYIDGREDGLGSSLIDVLYGLAIAKKNGVNFGGVLDAAHLSHQLNICLLLQEMLGVAPDFLWPMLGKDRMDGVVHSESELQQLLRERGGGGGRPLRAPIKILFKNRVTKDWTSHRGRIYEGYALKTLSARRKPPEYFLQRTVLHTMRIQVRPALLGRMKRCDVPQVALHVRHGDVDGEAGWSWRLTPHAYYLVLVMKISKLWPEAQLHLYSQVTPLTPRESFQLFEHLGVHLHLDEDELDAWAHFTTTQVLVTARSMFSYAPALLNPQCVIYQPHEMYPPLHGWINGEAVRHGDERALKNCIQHAKQAQEGRFPGDDSHWCPQPPPRRVRHHQLTALRASCRYLGKGLKPGLWVQDAEGCAAQCAREVQCTGFEYQEYSEPACAARRPQDDGNCRLIGHWCDLAFDQCWNRYAVVLDSLKSVTPWAPMPTTTRPAPPTTTTAPPTAPPTAAPTLAPTAVPSEAPTPAPTSAPTAIMQVVMVNWTVRRPSSDYYDGRRGGAFSAVTEAVHKGLERSTEAIGGLAQAVAAPFHRRGPREPRATEFRNCTGGLCGPRLGECTHACGNRSGRCLACYDGFRTGACCRRMDEDGAQSTNACAAVLPAALATGDYYHCVALPVGRDVASA